MFQESLIASNPARPSSRTPALLSIALQALVVSALLAVPLLHPDVLPLLPNKLTALTPPTLHVPPPPPPPQPIRVETSSALPDTHAPSAPTPRSAQLPVITTEAPPVDTPPLPFGTTGPANAGTLAILISGGSPQPHIVVANPGGGTPGTATNARPNISSGVIAGLLLAPIQPAYPPIAKLTRTEGSVVVQAVISKSGRIESARVLSGPTVLQSAALEAVRAARYRPFLLNNQPTEVETTITINFRLGS